MQALEQTALICAFRGLPFAAYFGVSPRFSLRVKLIAVSAYACVTALLVSLRGTHTLSWIVLGMLYYVGVATALPRCARALQDGRVTGGALFVAFTFAFFAVPNLALESSQAGPFIVLGWDLLMSSYSYCHDVARRREEPQLKGCLFFLFVDPTLTYGSRGKYVGSEGQQLRGIRRMALGVLVIFGANAVIRPALAAAPSLHFAAPEVVAVIALGVLRFVSEYAAHSGLASLQIGLMRVCGYQVPERYVYPWLARDPADFWRRWNTYVGTWLWQYIFAPITLPLWRDEAKVRRRGLRRALPLAGAVMVTFAASGLLHDGYNYFTRRTLGVFATELFVACGISILLWTLAGRLADGASRLQARVLPQLGSLTQRLSSTVSRVCLVASVIAALVVWG